jgi:hypothetical protein
LTVNGTAARPQRVDKARLYAVDTDRGRRSFVVVFGSGAAQVIATEP